MLLFGCWCCPPELFKPKTSFELKVVKEEYMLGNGSANPCKLPKFSKSGAKALNPLLLLLDWWRLLRWFEPWRFLPPESLLLVASLNAPEPNGNPKPNTSSNIELAEKNSLNTSFGSRKLNTSNGDPPKWKLVNSLAPAPFCKPSEPYLSYFWRFFSVEN